MKKPWEGCFWEEELKQLLKQDQVKFMEVCHWHESINFMLLGHLPDVLKELQFHARLGLSQKVKLMTDEEFLKTYSIREKGRNTLPLEWINKKTLEIDFEALDTLWLQPNKGRLHKALQTSQKNKQLLKLEKSQGFLYRDTGKSLEVRKQNRLTKLQKSVSDHKTVILLGIHNRTYQSLQKKLNEKYKRKKQFISDHVWSANGYTERGMKTSDNRLSVLQAAETIRRLPELNLSKELITARHIAFSLDGYDVRQALAAMYSNPNRRERNFAKPEIEGIEKFEFAHTGLTDLELANMVRNPYWFELLQFYKTGENGEPEELSKERVEEEYGICYIGKLMEEKYNRNK